MKKNFINQAANLASKHRLIVATSAITLIIGGTLAFNSKIEFLEEMIEKAGFKRGVASHSSQAPAPDKERSLQLARELNDESADLGLASAGREATPLVKLAIEQLEGRYAFVLDSGCLQQIQFSDGSLGGEGPKQLGDIKSFIEQNQALLCEPTIGRLEFKPVENRDERRYQKVRVLSRNGSQRSEMIFTTDQDNRLIDLKINRN